MDRSIDRGGSERHSIMPEGVLFIWLTLSTTALGGAQETWGYLWDIQTLRLHTLTGESVTVGRLNENAIVLNEPRVSRRHAEIRRSPEGVSVADRASTNGTRVNGVAVGPDRGLPLASGDVLQVAFEKLIYHESLSELWKDVLRFTYLGRVVHLKVPVLQDRRSKALGRERIIASMSQARVDPETEDVQMTYPDGNVGQPSSFQPEEPVFVCNVNMEGGELHLSLWGLERGKLVSRRGSLDRLMHGDLTIGVLSESAPEGQRRFEKGWASDGIRFLFPLMDLVMERSSEASSLPLVLELASALIAQEGATAARDAADLLALHFRLDPTHEEIAVLAARAELGWLKREAESLRGGLSEVERSKLMDQLAASREWLRKATDLGASKKDIEEAEAELAEAEKLLEGLS